MRYFLSILLTTAFFMLSAQEPQLVPIAPKPVKKKKKKKAADDNYKKLYQKYLNKYKKKTPKKKAEKKVVPAPKPAPKPAPQPQVAPTPAPQPQVAPTPAPQPQVAPTPAPQPQPQVAPTPAPQPQVQPQVQEQPKQVPDVAAPIEAKPMDTPKKEEPKVPAKPKVVLPVDFSFGSFVSVSNGAKWFGSELRNESYHFLLDNAEIWALFQNKNFVAKVKFDLTKGLGIKKEYSVNYDYDSSLDNSGKPEIDTTPSVPNMTKLLSDAYIQMNITDNFFIKTGKTEFPFGVENYGAASAPFYYFSPVRENFIGRIKDLGLLLGFKTKIDSDLCFSASYYLFNGSNALQLDGKDFYQAPAHGLDIRIKKSGDFFSETALSFVFGPSFHPYDTDENDTSSIFNHLKKVKNVVIAGSPFDTDAPNDFIANASTKYNFIFALGTNSGLKLDEDLKLGVDTQFIFSYRGVYNPTYTVGVNQVSLIHDGGKTTDTFYNWPSSYYSSLGFYFAPYVNVADFDFMVRFSYYNQPYVYTHTNDSENSNLGLDVMANYHISEYLGTSLNFRWLREEKNKYSSEDNGFYSNKYNFTEIMANLSFAYGKLFK